MRGVVLLFVLLLSSELFASGVDDTKHEKAPLEVSLPLLKSIEDHAFELGNGSTVVYVFIDPLCTHSRNFIEFIATSKKMLSTYHYYFFLYELARFKSGSTIRAIYAHDDIKQATLDVMLDNKTLPSPKKPNPEIEKKIARIASVGHVLDVYKRPYLILVKPQKATP